MGSQLRKEQLPKNQLFRIFIFSSIYILSIMNLSAQEVSTFLDNSKKSILARGCDPALSARFAKVVPPLIGNAEYIPTTDDTDFINQLKSRKWSVIYFAPGACRYNAAKRQICRPTFSFPIDAAIYNCRY